MMEGVLFPIITLTVISVFGILLLIRILGTERLSLLAMGPAVGLLIWGLTEFAISTRILPAIVPLAAFAVAFLLLLLPGNLSRIYDFRPPDRPRRDMSFWLAVSACGLAVLAFVWRSFLLPYGEYDAIAHWNLQARFLHGESALGLAAIMDFPEWSLPDYPPLLPILAASGWKMAAGTTVLVPIVIAAIFALGTAGALTFALPRSWSNWMLAVLLATPYFVMHASSQYADIPLAFCFTLAIGAYLHSLSNRTPAALLVAGFACGCGALFKNEGQAFLMAMGLVLVTGIVLNRQSEDMKRFLFWGGGLLLPLAALIYFKTAIAPPNYLFRDRTWETIASGVFSVPRMLLVANHLMWEIFRIDHWVLFLPAVLLIYGYLLVRSLPRPAEARNRILWIPAITFAAYIAAYLASPYSLEWQLPTSLPRLILQLWPVLLVLTVSAIDHPAAGNVLTSPVEPEQAKLDQLDEPCSEHDQYC